MSDGVGSFDALEERGLTPRGSLADAIRLDNGMTADRFMAWCEDQGIELPCIQPGKPDQNPFIARFNRAYRTEVLNA